MIAPCQRYYNKPSGILFDAFGQDAHGPRHRMSCIHKVAGNRRKEVINIPRQFLYQERPKVGRAATALAQKLADLRLAICKSCDTDTQEIQLMLQASR